jgi:UDP-glucose 4-epimerase
MIYASSAAVYGTPEALPLDESSRAAPLSPYGLEKLIDDQYAALFRQLYGFSAMGMRYFNVYGPRQDPNSPYSGVISKWSDALRAGRPLRIFGDGQQTRDFVYVKDIARYNVLALQHDAAGVCNVGTGRSVTLLALIEALESAAGVGAERKFEPPASGDIQASAMSPQRLNQLFGAQVATPLLEGLRALLGS